MEILNKYSLIINKSNSNEKNHIIKSKPVMLIIIHTNSTSSRSYLGLQLNSNDFGS